MNIYLIWFLVGVAFLVLEMVSPAFILFFFGLGAWITSISTFIMPNLTFNQQIIIFGSSSIVFLILLRNYVQTVFLGDQNTGEDKYSNVLQGDTSAVVTKNINIDEFGEIKFRGTFYKAKSANDSEFKKGDTINVIKQGDDQGSFYIVDKLK